MISTLVSCSVNNSAVEYLSAANTKLDSAQKYGADQLAEAEFAEAKALYSEAEMALQKNDKEALSIAQKAFVRARLAEALARQANAEAEATESEKAKKKAQDDAERASKERIAAENELSKMPID